MSVFLLLINAHYFIRHDNLFELRNLMPNFNLIEMKIIADQCKPEAKWNLYSSFVLIFNAY